MSERASRRALPPSLGGPCSGLFRPHCCLRPPRMRKATGPARSRRSRARLSPRRPPSAVPSTSQAPLFIRDQVATGGGSRLTMKLGRDTTLKLGEWGRVVIDRYLVDAGGEITLGSGSMLFDRPAGAKPMPGHHSQPVRADRGARHALLRRTEQRRVRRVRRTWPRHGQRLRQERDATGRRGDQYRATGRSTDAAGQVGRATHHLGDDGRQLSRHSRVLARVPARICSQSRLTWPARRTVGILPRLSGPVQSESSMVCPMTIPAPMSIHSTLVALLPNTSLFSGLSPDEIADCAALFRQARFDRGTTLFSRGDDSTHLYVLPRGGSASRSRPTRGGS